MLPNKLLARHLEDAAKVAKNNVIRGSDLGQRVRENLAANGCLLEIIKGWYFLTPPSAKPGDTTLWHGNFWSFLSLYLQDRFDEDYCLTAESSLDLWGGKTQTPKQVIVMTRKGGAGTTNLAFGASLMAYRDPDRFPGEPSQFNGLNVMSPGMALIKASPAYFKKDDISAQVVLKTTSSMEIARELLRYGKTASANRVVGALLSMGEVKKAGEVLSTLKAARLTVEPENPFEDTAIFPNPNDTIASPYAGRIQALWAKMREPVIASFAPVPITRDSKAEYLKKVGEIYGRDAYNSLSIEGYNVTPGLIESVRSGQYLEDNEENKKHRDAMAARGYYLAFQSVKDSLGKIFDGASPGEVVEGDLQGWYQQLFHPSVNAGIIPAYSLAGYREKPVFIKTSMHVPPPKNAVTDAMETLFKLLKAEEHPAVRAVLGHFVFVFIHPYPDGNGRIGRFLMNAMLASGGYPWTIVRIERRDQYMAALEEASVKHDITAFSRFISGEMQALWQK